MHFLEGDKMINKNTDLKYLKNRPRLIHLFLQTNTDKFYELQNYDEHLIKNCTRKKSIHHSEDNYQKNCDNKILYQTWQDALKGRNKTLSGGEIFSSLNVYKCPKNHNGYHVGHSRFLSNIKILERERKFSILSIA